MNEKKQLISSRLKEMRTKSGLFQAQVAERIGIDRVNVSNYEIGRAVPPWDVVTKLADLFDTSTDYLLGTTDDSTAKTAPHVENERELLSKIELTDEELLEQFTIEVDGRKLSQAEWKKIIAQVRFDRHYES